MGTDCGISAQGGRRMMEHEYPECIEDDFDRQDEPERPDDRERPEPVDERIPAWTAIASHPFFRDCYLTDGTLLDAMLAKLGTEPREVTTVEELDSLPVGTVVRERDSGTFCGIITVAGVFEKWAYDAKWHVVAGHGAHNSDHIDLPARVLYTPGANGSEL